MSTRILSDGSIQTYGKVLASDMNDIANFYRQHFGVNFTAPSGIIRLSDWNSLRQAILNGAGTTWGVDAPVFAAGIIRSSTWPVPKILFNSYEQEFAAVGATNVTIPNGCVAIQVELCVAGGGSGGFGIEDQNGGGGGGGGSGGWVENQRFTVTAGNTITVNIGAGGVYVDEGALRSSGSGGNSTILLNGSQIVGVGGGAGGGSAGPWNGGGGGASGSPNGNAGAAGQNGWDGGASSNGGNGGDGPLGGGGIAGTGGAGWAGHDGTSWGAGGGGGGSWDRNAPWAFHGGNGYQGYAKIKFLNPSDAA